MDSEAVHFMKWTISLYISRNGQFHTWVVTYAHRHLCMCHTVFFKMKGYVVFFLNNLRLASDIFSAFAVPGP